MYGFCVWSNIPLPLPELPREGPQDTDIRLVVNCLGESFIERSPPGFPIYEAKTRNGQRLVSIYKQQERAYLVQWYELADFYIPLDNRQIVCFPRDGPSMEYIWPCLIGPVFSFALAQWGTICLHASAVNFRGQAISFLAMRGGGKSTLGLYFLKKGHALVTDDILPLAENAGEIYAVPSYPEMKLWPETVVHFLGEGIELPKVHPEIEKRWVEMGKVYGTFSPDPLPLRAIYLLELDHLDQGETGVTITPLDRKEGMMVLIKNTSQVAMLNHKLLAHRFGLYAQIATQIPIRRLRFERRFELLPLAYSAILNDLAGLSVQSPMGDKRQDLERI